MKTGRTPGGPNRFLVPALILWAAAVCIIYIAVNFKPVLLRLTAHFGG